MSAQDDADDDTIRGLIVPGTSDVAPRPRLGSKPEEQPEVEFERQSGPEWRTGFHSFPPEEGSGERAQPSVLPLPSLALFTRRLLDVPRRADIAMHDEQIVHAVVEVLRDLLPSRLFCARLVEPMTEGETEPGTEPVLALFYATGRVLEIERGAELTVSRGAIENASLDPELATLSGWRVVPSYRPLFDLGAQGFDVVLASGDDLLGVLSVEYPPGVRPPDEDSTIVTALAVDLASRLRGARLLRESNWLRDYLARVIERANAPIAVIDGRGRLTQVNRALAEALDVEASSLRQTRFVDLLPKDERSEATAIFRAARDGTPLTDVELRVRAKGDQERRIAWSVAPLAGTDGEFAGLVAIGRDRTAERALESQIRHAEKLATLGQLAAGVVHELNNPLTSISVYGEYLLEKGRRAGQDPADLERLARIVESAARIQRFTRDLVTYARPSKEEPTRTRVTDVVDQALVFCDHVLGEARVELERRYDADVPPIDGVPAQLHQVFINLVTNACHAMAAGPPERARPLRISITSDDPFVRVEIADAGPGIAPAHLGRIFEPFFSTKGEGKGTGLGLSIVRSIVEAHGGSIEAQSLTEGSANAGERSGTTFVILLPVRSG